MYKDIITIATEDISSQWENALEGAILKQVVALGVTVDKEELLRALQYDRGQYDKGFSDGRRAAAPVWIPVTERLPEDGDFCICFDGRMADVLRWDERAEKWVDYRRSYPKYSVTHWMPLPEPPKEGE